MIYLIYERATGIVIGSRVGEKPPTLLRHHATVPVANPVEYDTVRVVDGIVRSRPLLDFDAPEADAMISVNGGDPIPAKGWKPPTTPGTYRAMAVGAYRGERVSIVRTLADEQAYLIGEVKTLAAQKKMTAISPGTAKPEEYRLKAPEIAASANLVAGVLNALTATQAAAQFPTAASEARCSGEPLATVLAGYRDGSAGSDAEVRRLSSIEHTAVKRIKAAKTIADKRAAYAAINWNWA